MNWKFTKGEIQTTNKYIRKRSTSVVIKRNNIKTKI